MTATMSTRPRLHSHIHINGRVIDKRDQTIWKITQIWRVDRQVQLVAHRTGERKTVQWVDLYRHYEPIQPFNGGER